jgi:hypothetical protein
VEGGPAPQGRARDASYHEAVSAKKAPPAGVLLSLLQAYQASSDFTDLRDRTRADYVKQIKLIEASFGDFPLNALGGRGTKAVFLSWRDELAKRSRRQADYAWTVLARVLSWAKNRGLTSDNPRERGGSLYHGSRSGNVWSGEDEAAFRTLHPRSLKRCATSFAYFNPASSASPQI